MAQHEASESRNAAQAIDLAFPGGVDSIPDVTYTNPSNGTKHLISAITAVVIALMAWAPTVSGHAIAPSTFVQAVAVGLLALSVWAAKYNPTWWKSAKAYVLGGQAIAAGVAPLVTNAIDGTGWHLSGAQWMAFAVAVVGVVAAIVTPNSQGMDNGPIKAALNAEGVYDVSTLGEKLRRDMGDEANNQSAAAYAATHPESVAQGGPIASETDVQPWPTTDQV